MLISKDENIKTSSVYVASLILKLFQKRKVKDISVFEISEHLKKHNVIHYRQMFFGLAFLYANGIIDFKEPYISIVNEEGRNELRSKTQSKSQQMLDFN